MSIRNILAASCVIVFAGGTAAVADCAEDLAALKAQSGAHAGISKDGSLAPLQENSEADPGAGTGEGATTAGTAGTASSKADGKIAKDGSVAPLQEGVSGGGSAGDVAVSGQDAQRQQEEAAADTATGEPETALQRAQAALDAGDEAGCREAVKEARGL